MLINVTEAEAGQRNSVQIVCLFWDFVQRCYFFKLMNAECKVLRKVTLTIVVRITERMIRDPLTGALICSFLVLRRVKKLFKSISA